MAAKKIRITLVKSLAKRLPAHKACVFGLGLKKMHQTKEVVDSKENRGMVNKVAYLLKVEEV